MRMWLTVGVIVSVFVGMIELGFAQQPRGRCGRNFNQPPYPGTWGQGAGRTQQAALNAAKQDFNQATNNATQFLTQWADRLACPFRRCPHKLILGIKHENYFEPALANIKVLGTQYVADVRDDTSISVYCYPIKVRDLQR